MILSWIGIVVGIAGILLGQVLEGGHLSSLMQPTAAFIVVGGTLGATLLSSTPAEFSGALRALPKVFFRSGADAAPIIKEILNVASIARRDGILALEKMIPEMKHPFFAKHLRQVVDGYDPVVLKDMMEERIEHEEEEKIAVAKVFETAGGFSPTIGIIGAVLGLIHVMENLSDSSKLGSGIAVAFVATVYGVGAANLILLPMGNKLKKIGKEEMLALRLYCTGLIGIQNGLNPRVIEDRLNNLLGEKAHGSAPTGGKAEAPAKKAA